MDIPLLILVLSLFAFSIFAIRHVGIEAGGVIRTHWWKQALFVGLGLGVMLVIACVDYAWIGKNSWVFYLFGLFMLTLVLIPGIGGVTNGARSWIPVFGFTIQPTEIAKPCTLVALAWYA